MAVTFEPFESESGFKSPGFLVDNLGNFSVASLNATGALKINGATVLTPTSLASSVVNSSLTSVGTLTSLQVNSSASIGLTTTNNLTITSNNATANVTNLTINSTGQIILSSGTTGSINNVDIGLQSPASAAFTTLNVSENLFVNNQNLKALAVAYSVALS